MIQKTPKKGASMSKSPNKPEPHECTCSGTEYLTVNNEFWCERHQVWKTQHFHELCQTRPGYRQMWEEGRGPGQAPKERKKTSAGKKRGCGRDRATKEQMDARMEVCRTCESWMGNNRCKHLDLGCGRVFLRALRSISGQCPAKKWDKTKDEHYSSGTM